MSDDVHFSMPAAGFPEFGLAETGDFSAFQFVEPVLRFGVADMMGGGIKTFQERGDEFGSARPAQFGRLLQELADLSHAMKVGENFASRQSDFSREKFGLGWE